MFSFFAFSDITGAVNTTSDKFLNTGKIIVVLFLAIIIAYVIITSIVIHNKYKKK